MLTGTSGSMRKQARLSADYIMHTTGATEDPWAITQYHCHYSKAKCYSIILEARDIMIGMIWYYPDLLFSMQYISTIHQQQYYPA